MSGTQLIKATSQDVGEVWDLIGARIAWMKERGLHQWDAYCDVYPRDYYLRRAEEGTLYLWKNGETTEGVAALLEADGRWDDDPAYFYVHHLTARIGCAGAGAAMLGAVEELAGAMGKKGVRLDSAVDDDRLSAYYEALGYPAVGPFREGGYEGMKRVKYLDLPIAFRAAEPADLEELWALEGECFPPNEMAERDNFVQRLACCPERFLLLTAADTGRICGFISGVYSDEPVLEDEMFSAGYQPKKAGENLILLGLNVREDCRHRSFASMLMRRCIAQAKESGLRRCVLTCHDYLIPYYETFGYVCKGLSNSVWGDVDWYDMVLELDG